MIRLALLGSCHIHGYAHALGFLLPEAEITAFEAAVIRHAGLESATAARLEGFAHIFTQPCGPEHGPLATEALAARGLPLHRLPSLVFHGYHPDMTYVAVGGDVHGSPVGAYHSAIIAGAFAAGLPEAAVEPLFNALTFRRLGYFDAFEQDRALLATSLAALGLDAARLLAGWIARGPFMHSINHPVAFALADLMTEVAIGAGLVPAGTPAPAMPFDKLANDTIWPVYPELGRALALPGHYRFKRNDGSVSPAGNVDFLTLQQMIARSYAVYATMPAIYLESHKVQQAKAVIEALRG